jgi:diguanylate cyclase (GGDEF)-like protein
LPQPALRFDPALESAYATERFFASRRFVRANLLLLMAIMVAVFATDRIVMPDLAALPVLATRLAYMLPALGLAFGVTFAPRADYWYPRVTAVVAVGMLCMVLAVGLWAWRHGEVRLIVRPIYAAIAIYFMLGLDFRTAVTVNGIGVGAFALLAWAWAGLPGKDLLYGLSTLVLTNILCMAGAYKLEHAERATWLKARQLAAYALLDGLTGLGNRRQFDEHFDRLWRQGQRETRPVSLLLIDIDYFKPFNDRYGHQAGDEALKALAGVLAASVGRPFELPARYGGEEFAVLLYDAGREFATRTADAIVRDLRGLAIPHADSPTGWLTVSIGSASAVPRAGRNEAGLLQLADQALYMAKDAGRNRVCALEEEYEHVRTGSFRRGPVGAGPRRSPPAGPSAAG